MAFSNIIMFFVMVTCATALNQHGVTNITSAATAAAALRPFAGDFAYALFALGIVATGLLAVPILAGSSAYAFAESFGWRRGLDMKFAEATAFYSIIVLSMLLGSLCMFLSIDPISLLFFAAVLNGLIAPIIIFYIVQVSAGLPRSRNSKMQTITGYTLVVLMGCVGYFAVAGLLY
jgi:Mn2+/Fe2+ NRAMP family transporter